MYGFASCTNLFQHVSRAARGLTSVEESGSDSFVASLIRPTVLTDRRRQVLPKATDPLRDRACAQRLSLPFSNAGGQCRMHCCSRHVIRETRPIVGILRSAVPASVRHPTRKPCRRRALGLKSNRTAPRSCSTVQFDQPIRIRAQPA
jgi:hypothetical protein